MPPGPPPTTAPADPAAPSAPPHPGDDSGGPSRPTPAPHRPQRPLASHPGDALGRPRNNPPDEEDPPEQTITTTFTPHVFKTTPEQPSGNCTLRARIVIMARVGGRGMLRVGLLGRSGAGACPNLLQRRPGPGSASRKSAEYQRFSSRAPARSRPLQQIWTTGAARGPPRGRPPLGRPPCGPWSTPPSWRTSPHRPSACSNWLSNLADDDLAGQQVFAGEATRLAHMTDEAVEGRNAFLQRRAPDWSPFPYYF